MGVRHPLAVSVRWMIRDDVAAVLAIERGSFARPWGVAELQRALRVEGAVGVVAESAGSVVGFMLYVPRGRALHVWRLAVAAGERRRGVGRRLVGRLVARLAPGRRTRVALGVPERALGAQLFLRACGFRAVAVVRGPAPGAGDDVYVFHREWAPGARVPRVAGRRGAVDRL